MQSVRFITLLWVGIVVIVIGYGIYNGYISYYYGALIATIFVPLYLILIFMSNEFQRSSDKFNNLLLTFNNYLRNEDFRRDLEVLPIFIEEKRKEYLRGLREGYKDISNLLNSLEEIKSKIEHSNKKIFKCLDRYERAITLLTEQIRRLQTRSSMCRELVTIRKREKLRRKIVKVKM